MHYLGQKISLIYFRLHFWNFNTLVPPLPPLAFIWRGSEPEVLICKEASPNAQDLNLVLRIVFDLIYNEILSCVILLAEN